MHLFLWGGTDARLACVTGSIPPPDGDGNVIRNVQNVREGHSLFTKGIYFTGEEEGEELWDSERREEVYRLGEELNSGDRAGENVAGVWNLEIGCCSNVWV